MEHKSYPKNVCGVVYDAKWKENWKGNMMPVRNQCQFSWFCDGKSDEPLDTKTWELSLKVAYDVLSRHYPDITEGATHYHTLYVDPYWSDSLNETVRITDHIFYK
jgi:spore germination cell wall hydrolase CwlJ-like protein